MTVVIDTSVFLPAAFWKGMGRKCWAVCAGRRYQIAVTVDVLGGGFFGRARHFLGRGDVGLHETASRVVRNGMLRFLEAGNATGS